MGIKRVRDRKGLEKLSNQEKKVLGYLETGMMNKQIAFIMGLSPKTITEHKTRLMKKLNVDNDWQLALKTVQLRMEAKEKANEE
jgi:DNA-binding NarL/FixJ family response regulator